ncbi:hypothetical protein F5ESL0233_04135 [Lactobacillus sp. ESL0233]|uniref:hypothetical protein n=1 Tax=Lactobacillus sp. ESL0233 TaxID=2069354 RepID=UPI000EFC03B8|nr:hypothetical protein [Lactobacillus sp. ESL0233]RMC41523.1 hypothetical protein F5ESL0233_04135 [Lactobacillus sp. ESL0233]
MKNHRIINMYNYFQNLRQIPIEFEYKKIAQIFSESDYHKVDEDIYVCEDNSIKLRKLLDNIKACNSNERVILIFDRIFPIDLPCITVNSSCKVLFVFHSTFLNNGRLRPVYQNFPALINNKTISKFIVSTVKQKQELMDFFKLSDNQIAVIPVTSSLKEPQVSYSDRDPNKVSLVSRISEEKMLMML